MFAPIISVDRIRCAAGTQQPDMRNVRTLEDDDISCCRDMFREDVGRHS